MPLTTQSDLGSENWNIAYCHSFLRHHHDLSLEGTIQHRWRRKAKNVKPEIGWRELRTRWSPGFEGKLDWGLREEEIYHRDVYDEKSVFSRSRRILEGTY